MIAVGGSLSLLQAAQQATRSIPIVAVFQEDPVATGLVASLAKPGGNLTGVTNTAGHELAGKRVQFLKELAPQIARVAFLGTRPAWEAYGSKTDAAGVALVLAQVDRPDQFVEAFALVLRERADALIVSSGAVNYVHSARIVAFAAQHRLPAIHNFREAVDLGGLMSYGPNNAERYRELAGLVHRILKGANPADLAIAQPTKFELAINLKTAKALGLTVPPSLLASADEVIE